MIPDLAIIVSAYAVARLLCEYVLDSPKVEPLRTLVAFIAIGVIVLFLVDILGSSASLSEL